MAVLDMTKLRPRAPSALCAFAAVLAAGCAASDGGPASGNAGTSGGGTHTGVGGSSEKGGDGSGVGGTGGMGVGGNDGEAEPDGAAGTPGRGGADGAGGGAVSVDGGLGGGGPAIPSAGCAKMAMRPAGGKVMVTNDRIYDFPASYDGKTPMPLLIALHAAGNPYTQLEGLTNGTRLATDFVRAFPKSAGSAWVYNTDAQHVAAVYDDLVQNYCVDTSRVFATGHSSGAQMVVQMLCARGGEKRFKAVAPVAAGKYCDSFMPVAVMYIQGMMDAMRGNGNGIDVVNMFTKSNTCGATTMPDMAVPMCTSTFDHMTVNPNCVTYQGCTKPTIWCSHNDHGYNATDGSEHGWPCFASSAMADFFLGLP